MFNLPEFFMLDLDSIDKLIDEINEHSSELEAMHSKSIETRFGTSLSTSGKASRSKSKSQLRDLLAWLNSDEGAVEAITAIDTKTVDDLDTDADTGSDTEKTNPIDTAKKVKRVIKSKGSAAKPVTSKVKRSELQMEEPNPVKVVPSKAKTIVEDSSGNIALKPSNIKGMPLVPNTVGKVVPSVENYVPVDDSQEEIEDKKLVTFYSKFSDLAKRIEWLDSVDLSILSERERKLHRAVLNRAEAAYDRSLDAFDDLVEAKFPISLDALIRDTQRHVFKLLSDIEDEKRVFFFDKSNVSLYKTARATPDETTYSFVLHLNDVVDAEDYVHPDYLICVSLRLRGKNGLPTGYFVTRLFKDALDFNLGNEFHGLADLKVKIGDLLAADQVRTHNRQVIPAQLANKFIGGHNGSAHIESIKFFSKRDVLRIVLNDSTDAKTANYLAQSLGNSLLKLVSGGLAVKHKVVQATEDTPLFIDLILVPKGSDSLFTRSQLLDLRDRYSGDPKAFDELIKRLVSGN